jgi:hypothetical protein
LILTDSLLKNDETIAVFRIVDFGMPRFKEQVQSELKPGEADCGPNHHPPIAKSVAAALFHGNNPRLTDSAIGRRL